MAVDSFKLAVFSLVELDSGLFSPLVQFVRATIVRPFEDVVLVHLQMTFGEVEWWEWWELEPTLIQLLGILCKFELNRSRSR